MTKNLVKTVSVLLTASMALSVAACSTGKPKSGKSGKKITDDSPWYETTSISLAVDVDDSRQVDYEYHQLAGADKDNIVILTSGYYRMPNEGEIDWATYDYNDYAINQISVIDRNTKQLTHSIDLSKQLESGDYLERATYSNGVLTATYSSYNDITYQMMQKEVDIDINTEQSVETRSTINDEGSYERSFKVGSYKVYTRMEWNENAEYTLYIYTPDGDVNTVDIREAGKDYYDIPFILPITETQALVPVSTDNGYVFFELDLKTTSISEAEKKEYEWIDMDQCYDPFIGSDNNVYFKTNNGISVLDFKKKSTETVFDYSWCGLSRNTLSMFSIADFSEESFVLCGEKYDIMPFESSYNSEFMIIEFTKADKNPHAGKTILELYSTNGYIEEVVSDAIIEFNDSNSEYYIEVTDRYDSSDYIDYTDINSDDQYEKAELNANSKISNQLAMDIINGEGPDILMNVSSFGQLNNKNYLVDLTPYLGDVTSDKYFTNILDGSKVDGSLYNLPVCFMISGIHTDYKYAGASGVGFTTAEYEDFLKNTLNGDDVLVSGQPYYFAKLFNNMSDKFIVNGKADFSGPEFEELAYFVKENVREYSKDWNDSSYAAYDGYMSPATEPDYSDSDDRVALYTVNYGISSYLLDYASLNGASAVLGIPSCDGRGPMIENNISVAISAQACSVDACGEFVKILLSDNIQTHLAMSDNFVLNRDAFRAGAIAAIDYYNGEGGDGLFAYDYATGKPLDSRVTFSESTINDVENIILSCNGMYSADADIDLILIEEMPAYFSGQKELSDVISIAQERAQKVLNERG